jgi:hypothetical protein
MRGSLLLVFVMTIAMGCSSTPSGQPQESAAEVAEHIKKLVPEASSCPNQAWMAFSDRPPRMDDLEKHKLRENANHPLSLVLFAMEAERSGQGGPPKDKDTFVIDKNEPKKVAEALSKSASKGYGTLLQPEFLRECRCVVNKVKATGTVAFQAEGVYHGRVEYTARRINGKWQIEEFRLPGYGLKIALDAKGLWKVSKV